MWKALAFKAMGVFLTNLLGSKFFDLLKKAVFEAMAADKSGEEKKQQVKETLRQAVLEGRVVLANTSNWAINLAIEYIVAKAKVGA